MSKKMAGIIMAYGVALAGLSLAIKTVAPELAKISFLTGLLGGGLCVLWGLIALTGAKRRVAPLLTMAVVALVVLSPMLRAWMEASGTVGGRLLLTLMLLLTVAMIMYVMHGERPPEFYQKEPPRQDGAAASGKNPPALASRPRR
jgi:hypothetical protein